MKKKNVPLGTGWVVPSEGWSSSLQTLDVRYIPRHLRCRGSCRTQDHGRSVPVVLRRGIPRRPERGEEPTHILLV